LTNNNSSFVPEINFHLLVVLLFITDLSQSDITSVVFNGLVVSKDQPGRQNCQS